MVANRAGLQNIIFDKFIQTSVVIIAGDSSSGSVLRRGKLLNCNLLPSFLHLKLLSNERIRNYYIPYPFGWDMEDGHLKMYYTIESMSDDKICVDKLLEYGKDTDSKIFNKHVYIKITDD